MRKRIERLLTALLAAALAFAALAPPARAEDAERPIYYPYWRMYTGEAFLPRTETVTDDEDETREYRFEYELLRDEEGDVSGIVGRKYDEAGTLVELREFDGRGVPLAVTAYRDGEAVERIESAYRYNGINWYALSEETRTDLRTGETRRVEYYQAGRCPIPVEDGETPDFSFDPETRQIGGTAWWETPVLSAAVIGPDGRGGRIFERVEQEVSWPAYGTVLTELCYERLDSGERGAILSTRHEYLSWFDGPCYVVTTDHSGGSAERTEDFYDYDGAFNVIYCWTHRGDEGEELHRYTFYAYSPLSGLTDTAVGEVRGEEWEDPDEDW